MKTEEINEAQELPKPKEAGRPVSEFSQQVLDYLKAHGPSTAREIHEGLGYTWEVGQKHTKIRTALGGLVGRGTVKTEPQKYSLDIPGNRD